MPPKKAMATSGATGNGVTKGTGCSSSPGAGSGADIEPDH